MESGTKLLGGWVLALLSSSTDLGVGWGKESPVTPENQAFYLQSEIAPLRVLKNSQMR